MLDPMLRPAKSSPLAGKIVRLPLCERGTAKPLPLLATQPEKDSRPLSAAICLFYANQNARH